MIRTIQSRDELFVVGPILQLRLKDTYNAACKNVKCNRYGFKTLYREKEEKEGR